MVEDERYCYRFDYYLHGNYVGDLSRLIRVLPGGDNNREIMMVFTENEFSEFRSSLAVVGIVLRGIKRTPYYTPEVIF